MTVQPVSFLSLIGMALTLIISAGVPVLLFIRWRKNRNVRISSLIFGAIVYYVAAKVLEPSANAAILSNVGGAMMKNMFIYAVYVGLIAVVIEEGCRYLTLKSLVKNVDEDNALFFGLGFCGLEAILTAAWPQVSNILNSVLINNGMMGRTLEMLQEPDLSATYFAIAPLWETPALTFMLAGLERALIILMHICLSLLIFYFIKSGNKKHLAVALIAHFAVVAFSALMSQMDLATLSVLVTAAVTAALAVFTQRSHKEYEANRPMGEYAVLESAGEENVQDN